MLANEKLPPFKWAIVYYNRFVFAAFICLTGLSLGIGWMRGGYCQPFLSYVIVAVAGFLLYEVLYQSRGVLFNLGHTRFYCLVILFYLPFLFNIFIFNNFLLIKVPFSLTLSPSDLAYLIFYKLVIFGLSIAVVWFIFGVEFEQPRRKEMDIKALLIEDRKLHSWNNNLVAGGYIFSVLVITCYSLPLGVIAGLIIVLQHMIGGRVSIVLMIGAATICLMLGINFKLDVLNLAHGWFNYYVDYGFYELVKKQLYSFSKVLDLGVTLIASPLFLLELLAKVRLSKTDVRNIELYLKEAAKNNDIGGAIDMGINALNNRVVKLTEMELNNHALYVGTTGGGKTSAILCNVEYCAINGIPCVVMDGKGSPDLPDKIKYLADKHGRKFKLFTVKPEALSEELLQCLASYNPFATGTHTEWKNRVMSLFAEADGRGQQHYALQEEAKLNIIVQLIKQSGARMDLRLLLEYVSDPQLMKSLAHKAGDLKLIQELAKLYPDEITGGNQKEQGLGDIELVLKLFINSSYGYLFDSRALNRVIELQQNIIDNEIVLFMLDSSAFKEDTKKIAKMVINDINSTFSSMKERNGKIKTCFCIFDEFASYASSNLSDTLTLHCTLPH